MNQNTIEILKNLNFNFFKLVPDIDINLDISDINKKYRFSDIRYLFDNDFKTFIDISSIDFSIKDICYTRRSLYDSQYPLTSTIGWFMSILLNDRLSLLLYTAKYAVYDWLSYGNKNMGGSGNFYYVDGKKLHNLILEGNNPELEAITSYSDLFADPNSKEVSLEPISGYIPYTEAYKQWINNGLLRDFNSPGNFLIDRNFDRKIIKVDFNSNTGYF